MLITDAEQPQLPDVGEISTESHTEEVTDLTCTVQIGCHAWGKGRDKLQPGQEGYLYLFADGSSCVSHSYSHVFDEITEAISLTGNPNLSEEESELIARLENLPGVFCSFSGKSSKELNSVTCIKKILVPDKGTVSNILTSMKSILPYTKSTVQVLWSAGIGQNGQAAGRREALEHLAAIRPKEEVDSWREQQDKTSKHVAGRQCPTCRRVLSYM